MLPMQTWHLLLLLLLYTFVEINIDSSIYTESSPMEKSLDAFIGLPQEDTAY